jgi:hypothetical protein
LFDWLCVLVSWTSSLFIFRDFPHSDIYVDTAWFFPSMRGYLAPTFDLQLSTSHFVQLQHPHLHNLPQYMLIALFGQWHYKLGAWVKCVFVQFHYFHKVWCLWDLCILQYTREEFGWPSIGWDNALPTCIDQRKFTYQFQHDNYF